MFGFNFPISIFEINTRVMDQTATRQDNTNPSKAIFVDLIITAKGNRFELGYDEDKMGVVYLTGSTAEADFKAALKEFAHPSTPQSRPGDWKGIDRKKYRSKLSLQCDALTYFVVRLSSKREDWRFCHIDDPFTVQKGYGKIANEVGPPVAFDAKRVIWDSNIGDIEIINGLADTNEIGSDSRVSYMVIDGSALKTKYKYSRVPFNIHVEVVDDDSNYIPIIIDPDMGYPDGGSPP